MKLKLRIFKTMGYERGKRALDLLKQAKKAGLRDINITNLSSDVLEINCINPSNNELTNFKFNFVIDKQYQTTDFHSTVLSCWDRKRKITEKYMSGLTTGRDFGTLTHTIITDNGKVSSDVAKIESHTSGTIFERIVKPDGKAEYFRQFKNGQREKLFSK